MGQICATQAENSDVTLMDGLQARAAVQQQQQAPSITKKDMWDEEALSHKSGLALLFLGTGTGHPGEQR